MGDSGVDFWKKKLLCNKCLQRANLVLTVVLLLRIGICLWIQDSRFKIQFRFIILFLRIQ